MIVERLGFGGASSLWNAVCRLGRGLPCFPTAPALGLDIGSRSLAMVELGRRSPSAVSRWAVQQIDAVADGDDEDRCVKKALQEFVHTHRLRRARVAAAVSGPGVCVKTVSVPSMSLEELEAHLAWEIDKYIPYSHEDVYWDFYIQPDAQDSPRTAPLSVLLAAARKEIVDRRLALLNDVGLVPAIIDVEGLALSHVYLHAPRAPEGNDDAVLWVNCDSCRLTMAIIHRRRIVVVRDVTLNPEPSEQAVDNRRPTIPHRNTATESDGQAIEASATFLEHVVGEVRRTVHYGETVDHRAAVARILVSGDCADLPGLSSRLCARLSMDVQIVDPFQYAGIDGPETDTGLRVRPAIASGLALRAIAP